MPLTEVRHCAARVGEAEDHAQGGGHLSGRGGRQPGPGRGPVPGLRPLCHDIGIEVRGSAQKWPLPTGTDKALWWDFALILGTGPRCC